MFTLHMFTLSEMITLHRIVWELTEMITLHKNSKSKTQTFNTKYYFFFQNDYFTQKIGLHYAGKHHKFISNDYFTRQIIQTYIAQSTGQRDPADPWPSAFPFGHWPPPPLFNLLSFWQYFNLWPFKSNSHILLCIFCSSVSCTLHKSYNAKPIFNLPPIWPVQ